MPNKKDDDDDEGVMMACEHMRNDKPPATAAATAAATAGGGLSMPRVYRHILLFVRLFTPVHIKFCITFHLSHRNNGQLTRRHDAENII